MKAQLQLTKHERTSKNGTRIKDENMYYKNPASL